MHLSKKLYYENYMRINNVVALLGDKKLVCGKEAKEHFADRGEGGAMQGGNAVLL